MFAGKNVGEQIVGDPDVHSQRLGCIAGGAATMNTSGWEMYNV